MGKDEKIKILGKKLDCEELKLVTGGTHASATAQCPNKGNIGNCSAAYYVGGCQATLEAGSACWGTDWCARMNVHYGKSAEADRLFPLDCVENVQKPCYGQWN